MEKRSFLHGQHGRPVPAQNAPAPPPPTTHTRAHTNTHHPPHLIPTRHLPLKQKYFVSQGAQPNPDLAALLADPISKTTLLGKAIT